MAKLKRSHYDCIATKNHIKSVFTQCKTGAVFIKAQAARWIAFFLQEKEKQTESYVQRAVIQIFLLEWKPYKKLRGTCYLLKYILPLDS